MPSGSTRPARAYWKEIQVSNPGQFNQRLPLAADVLAAHGVDAAVPPCLFCGCDHLRIGGNEASSFLACPDCGADGPLGRAIYGAWAGYTMNHHPAPTRDPRARGRYAPALVPFVE